MKSKTLTLITSMTLFAALAMPLPLAAQDNQNHNHKHVRYTLTDLCTLGGSHSTGNGLNNRGQVAGRLRDHAG
jgi:hypothetical protein